MTEKQPLAEALRSEILKLATDGDPKSDGALTAAVLLRIMRVAKTGRELLVSLESSPKDLASMLRRPRSGLIPMIGENLEDDGLGDGLAPNYLPFATSSPAENFGMTAMREIIAAVKGMNGGTSPARLVEAIAIAKEKGLHDVADRLEKQLDVGNGKPLPEKVPDPEKKESA